MVTESVSQSMSLSAVCLLSVYLSQYHPLGRNGVIKMSLKPRNPIFRNYRIYRPCFKRELASATLYDILSLHIIMSLLESRHAVDCSILMLLGAGGAAAMMMCVGPLFCTTETGQCCFLAMDGGRLVCPISCS